MLDTPNDQGGTDHADGADLIADGAPIDTVSGGYLISPDDLAAAVGNQKPVFSGDWDDSGAPSREELVRIRTLKGYHDDPDTMWRRHVIADQCMIDRLTRLATTSPNIARAIEIVRRAAVLSKYGRVPLQVPPVVLVGPPGVGKTRYATSLAAALGVSLTLITGSTITDVGKIIGYHPSWKGAGPGLVAKSLLGCTTTSPVVVIDEAEKISAVDGLPFPLDALLAALEPSTARNYRDGYLDVPMNAGGVIWMLCVNDLAGVSAPLLDRCIVVQVSALSGVERDRALADMAADVALDHNIAPFPLAAADLAVLAAVPLRRARTVMAAALAAAIDDGRDWPTPADYRTALDIVGGATPTRRRPAGFVQFTE